MPDRRDVLSSVGALAVAALAGRRGLRGTRSETAHTSGRDETGETGQQAATSGPIRSSESAVTFARSVEEVRGHLVSSATLLERGRRADAALHAGHPSDYFAAILTPLRDTNPELATRTRAVLETPARRVRSMSASDYRQYLADEVFPVLDRVVEAVVASDLRESTSFAVQVMGALAGRIAEEYSAAVPSAGTVELEGEYWDSRGFLVRSEKLYSRAESTLGGDGSETLSQLRTDLESLVAAKDLRLRIFRFRTETAAAADLPSATVEGREEALAYVRNVEEVQGHLDASVALKRVGDEDAALHAGHPLDYVTTVLPPVQAADAALAGRLLDRVAAAEEHVASMATSAYEQFVTGELFPLLEQAVSTVVSTRDTPFSAAVFLALGDRLLDEYDAAVTGEEVIELYGEYCDGRGFLTRMESRFADFGPALDSQTRSAVSEGLGILRTEMETTQPPSDVAGTVEALHDMLDEVARA